MPDIMARAGCRLVEVGTTNRTHLKDYAAAIGPDTGLIMKVHTSNYAIEGFTRRCRRPSSRRSRASRACRWSTISAAARWSISTRFGLPHEPTVARGGRRRRRPRHLLRRQAAGRPAGRASSSAARSLIARIARNPMKRALRLDKIRLAALEATLRLYADPDRLAERLPTLRVLARPAEPRSRALAERLLPVVAAGARRRRRGRHRAGARARSARARCRSTCCRRSRHRAARQAASTALAAAFRGLPIPVIGRISDGTLCFDLRCLDDEAASPPTSRPAPMSWLGRIARRRAPPRHGPRPLRRLRTPATTASRCDLGAARPCAAMPGRRAISAPASPKASASSATRRLAVDWLTLRRRAGRRRRPAQPRHALLQRRGRRAGPGRGRRAGTAQAAEAGRRRRPGHAVLDAARGRRLPRRTTPRRAGWARAAAAQGRAGAMTRLGMIHHNALGVRARPGAGGRRWWQRAAERGDADGAGDARRGLSHLGKGVARDPVAALVWLLRAQAGGSALADRSCARPSRAAAAELAASRAPMPGAAP